MEPTKLASSQSTQPAHAARAKSSMVDELTWTGAWKTEPPSNSILRLRPRKAMASTEMSRTIALIV